MQREQHEKSLRNARECGMFGEWQVIHMARVQPGMESEEWRVVRIEAERESRNQISKAKKLGLYPKGNGKLLTDF